MIFYFIRHGNPIYNPDSLTELGKKQAESLAKRLAIYGLDKIYVSTSNRAIMTAQPTCDLLKMDMELLDFCNESYAWESLTTKTDYGMDWIFRAPRTLELFTSPEVIKMGFEWYNHPELSEYKNGIERIYDESDKLFVSLGYEHERYTGRYKAVKPNDEKVALFAHAGFGLAFLSCVLDIPYSLLATRFDLGHSSMTVIDFDWYKSNFIVPKVRAWSSDSHLYREGIPATYDTKIKF